MHVQHDTGHWPLGAGKPSSGFWAGSAASLGWQPHCSPGDCRAMRQMESSTRVQSTRFVCLVVYCRAQAVHRGPGPGGSGHQDRQARPHRGRRPLRDQCDGAPPALSALDLTGRGGGSSTRAHPAAFGCGGCPMKPTVGGVEISPSWDRAVPLSCATLSGWTHRVEVSPGGGTA